MRGFRPRQKGLVCVVAGCDNWRVSNDLCSKHNMALHRYGSVNGKAKTKRICRNPECGKEFEHKYDSAVYCSLKCYCAMPEHKAKTYQAVKKHRAKNIDKARERDRLGKRTRRRFGSEGVCVVVGCGKKAETHHPDYDKPYEIVWLCRQHHKDTEYSRNVFKKEDILCDVIWKEALEKHGIEKLKGTRFLRGKAVFTEEELVVERRQHNLHI